MSNVSICIKSNLIEQDFVFFSVAYPLLHINLKPKCSSMLIIQYLTAASWMYFKNIFTLDRNVWGYHLKILQVFWKENNHPLNCPVYVFQLC